MLARQPHEEALTLPNLIAWLEKQPADGRYEFCYPQHCLLAQFMHANGFPDAHFGDRDYGIEHLDGSPYRIPSELAQIAHSRTFGEALQKAYKQL